MVITRRGSVEHESRIGAERAMCILALAVRKSPRQRTGRAFSYGDETVPGPTSMAAGRQAGGNRLTEVVTTAANGYLPNASPDGAAAVAEVTLMEPRSASRQSISPSRVVYDLLTII